MGERRNGLAGVLCALMLGACSWSAVPASAPAIVEVEVVERPVIEVHEGGARGPRPTPTATWDADAGGWSYHAPELVIEIDHADDAVGYAIGRGGRIFSTHLGDLPMELTVDLSRGEVEAGDVLEVHAFRHEVPGFPHQEGSGQAAGLSRAVEVVVPPH